MDFSTNKVVFETNFDEPKFFVYNDNYHSDWRAFLNGEQVPLYRSNIAFKGVYLPPGKNMVVFRYGSLFDVIFGYSYVVLFGATLMYLVYLCWRFRRSIGCSV